jgi:hypothetical protein
MATAVGTEYQLVIEPQVRARLGVQPGWVAVQTVVGDHLEVRFLRPEQGRSLAGSLHAYARAPVEDWQAAKQAAWDAEVEAKWGPRKSSTKSST